MEEQALYRAILDAPNDDTPRLVYADWLDEHADELPALRSERARAELIRVQCEFARLLPEGWRVPPRPFAPALEKRERRLLFQHGKKWRRAFPITIASAPFDRGFLRPFVALRPQEFLESRSPSAPLRVLSSLSLDSLVRRYVPENGDIFDACPLWDIHLFASTWYNDAHADHGQYGALLAEVGRSPLLERVGWLKVSFFGTPVYDFLRHGNFANVETLIINAGPLPEALEAVSENESFRSLRYVHFGYDIWSWAPTYAHRQRLAPLENKLRGANMRHLPFGEMRTALRAILRDTPLPPAPLPQPPAPVPVLPPIPAFGNTAPLSEQRAQLATVKFVLIALVLWVIGLILTGATSAPKPKRPDPGQLKPPNLEKVMPKAKLDLPLIPKPETEKKGSGGLPEPVKPSERKD